MQTVVAAAQARHACSYFFGILLFQPIASASLSPSGTWLFLWRDGDTSCKTAHNAWSIPSNLMPTAGNLGATHSIHHPPTCRSAHSWNRGRQTPFLFQLLWGWRGCSARYSALACGRSVQSQCCNTLPPNSARNAQTIDSKPWLSTSQTSASALAVGVHHQVLSTSAGDLPSNKRHTTCEAPWLAPWRALLKALPVSIP